MNIVAKIYLILSIISILSGIASLFFGYTQANDHQAVLNPIFDVIQILLALLTLSLTVAYLKGKAFVKNFMVASIILFSVLLTYTVYFR